MEPCIEQEAAHRGPVDTTLLHLLLAKQPKGTTNKHPSLSAFSLGNAVFLPRQHPVPPAWG